MKPRNKNLFLLPTLIAGLGLILAGRMAAQTFTTLYNFTAAVGPSPATNSDGAHPYGGLILSSNTLYGTAAFGGGSGNGTVFAVNIDGTGFTNLYNFTALNNSTNSDGANSYAKLILSGNTLYGAAEAGGSSGNGTVFRVNIDGTGFTNLHGFTATYPATGTNSDGANPTAGLILLINTLYGTAAFGGISGNGTVFAVNTDGTGFTNLHSFISASDGANPTAGLILSGNALYGTARSGGSSNRGTVFRVNIDGTEFTNLYNVTYSDGGGPYGGLILSGNLLCGTMSAGGGPPYGTVFAINTNGTGFTNLHSFTNYSGGANPYGNLILSGSTLYGTTLGGGSSGWGTVFKVNTNGTDFTKLYNFTGGSDGAGPWPGLILSGNTLYGTAHNGGSSGWGTVFSLSFVPQLIIIPSGTNVILTWPTNVAGFDYSGYILQSTTNLVSPVVWSTNVPGPVVVNGQYTVTNPISGAQQFYRLSQ